MTSKLIHRWLLTAMASLLIHSLAAVASTDIDFTSIISGKTNIDGSLRVTVSLHGVEVDLIVNEGTSIEVGGEDATFDELNIGDFVRVETVLSTEGIVAEEINVLDSQKEEFRLRGIVQATANSGDNIILTLLNIDVVVPPTTDVIRRGSRVGNNVPPTDLQAGDEVSIFGLYEDMSLVARRIHIGNRPQGMIELEGVITSVSSDGETLVSVTLLAGDAAVVTVMIDENTFIGGTLAENVFVEVKGYLDEEFTLLGFEIIVDEDGDGDADDDNHRGRGRGPDNPGSNNNGGSGSDDDDDSGSASEDDDNEGPELEIEAETSLTAVSGQLVGKAKVSYEEYADEVEQEFEVEIEDASPNSNYGVEIDFGATTVSLGELSTNDEGEGEIEFSTSPDAQEEDLTPLIPAGLDVRDITAIRVYDGATLVLEGSF